MGTVYVFFADGFEEIEAFTSVDVMRRAGLKVEMITEHTMFRSCAIRM